MIISHKHQFIFIKTEKTAGTSLEIALSQYCGPEDIITPIVAIDEKKRKELGFPNAQNYTIPFKKYTLKDWGRYLIKQKKAIFYNHMPAHEIQRILPKKIWNNYYKFCFERNPWDKHISWYFWKNRNQKYQSIEAFINAGEASKLKGYELYTDADTVLVDDVFQFESIPEALQKISEQLEFDTPLQMPEYRAKSYTRTDTRSYREILSPETAEVIRTMAHKEIALLGYTF